MMGASGRLIMNFSRHVEKMGYEISHTVSGRRIIRIRMYDSQPAIGVP